MPSEISLVSAALAVAPIKSASSPSSVDLGADGVGSAVPAQPHASPVSLLDSKTGLVVLEFYNANGQETQSFPNKRQLESYRLHETSNNVFQPDIPVTPVAVAPSAAKTQAAAAVLQPAEPNTPPALFATEV